MTKAGRSTLAVAMSLLLPLSLPELTCAQQPVSYGTWSGYETYTETDYDQWGNVIGVYSWAGNSSLTVDIIGPAPDFYATVAGPLGFSPYAYYDVTSFGPMSAIGYASAGGAAGYEGDFDLSYPFIHPDGQIEDAGGFADADFSGNTFFAYGFEPYSMWSASFNSFSYSVPEPSAIVPMAIGAAVVATSVVIRRRRAGNALERARATGGLE